MAFNETVVYNAVHVDVDEVSGQVLAMNSRMGQIGLAANRPAFGNAGVMWYATDTGAFQYDTGSAWADIDGGESHTHP